MNKTISIHDIPAAVFSTKIELDEKRAAIAQLVCDDWFNVLSRLFKVKVGRAVNNREFEIICPSCLVLNAKDTEAILRCWFDRNEPLKFTCSKGCHRSGNDFVSLIQKFTALNEDEIIEEIKNYRLRKTNRSICQPLPSDRDKGIYKCQ